MNIRKDELLAKIRLSRKTKNRKQFYRKVGTRKAQAISKVCIAALGQIKENKLSEIRIAFASVAPTPLRCHRTEKVLNNQKLNETLIQNALIELENEISPIDDIRSTKKYRSTVSKNLLRHYLEMF